MKIRCDFVSNSSSCSFFVGLDTEDDIAAFKQLSSMLKEKNVDVQMFCSLEHAHSRWEGIPFDFSEQMMNALRPGYYLLIDTGEDHYKGYEYRFWDIKDRFVEGHKFKLYNDKEAHMSVEDDLPKAKEY